MLPGQGQIDLRVKFLLDAVHGDVAIGADGAAADGGGAPLHVQIHGGADGSHDGVDLVTEGLQGGLGVVLGDVEGLADDGLVKEVALHHALIRGGRHPSVLQGGAVEPLGDGHELEDRVLVVAHMYQHIQGNRALGIGNTVEPGEGEHIIVRPAVAVYHLQIEHILLIRVVLHRGDHVHLGHLQTGEQSRTQGDDGDDGDVSADGMADGLGQISPHHVLSSHYHSISEISWGLGLTVTEATVPLWTRMTRSAMAVRAALWVMMMMVMPVLRPVSCRSRRMALPVL